MKSVFSVVLALLLVGCTPDSPEEIERINLQRQEKIKQKMENLNEQLHICDNNGGTVNIVYGKYSTRVSCANGVSKDFSNY